LRAIRSVTATRSCDSIPVPATKPCSSAFMRVTPTPDGFFTPLEAQPTIKAPAVSGINKLEIFFILYCMDRLENSVAVIGISLKMLAHRARAARRRSAVALSNDKLTSDKVWKPPDCAGELWLPAAVRQKRRRASLGPFAPG